MESVKILVLEDNFWQREALAKKLESYGYSVYKSASMEKALEFFRKINPDIVLLDIRIGNNAEEGITTGEEIRKLDPFVPLIYITAYPNLDPWPRKTALNMILSKPYREIDLINAIKLLTPESVNFSNARFRHNLVHIRERAGGSWFKVPYSRILYLEADNTAVKVHTDIKKNSSGRRKCFYVSNVRLKDFMDSLPDKKFGQTHKSFVVNLDRFTGFNQNQIFLDEDDLCVPLSRSFRDTWNKFSRYN